MPRRRKPSSKSSLHGTPASARRSDVLVTDQCASNLANGKTLLLMLTLALLALALIPCASRIWLDPYWETDPRTAAALHHVTAISPAVLAHVASIALSGTAIALHRWSGGRVDWRSLLLVTVGCGSCAIHMPAHMTNTMLGGAWIAAACTGLAMLHLAQHAQCRRWAIAALAAMLIPMLLQSLLYVLRDHAMIVNDFLEREDEILRMRGWLRDSPQHLAFKRRLMFADATGPFALSNVFGSVVAAYTLLAIGRVGDAFKRQHRRVAIAALLATLAGVLTLWLTHSRGAIGTFIIGVALVVVLAWFARKGSIASKCAPWIGIALVVCAVLTVLVRGAVGPPESADDPTLSLLYRFHYWQGAADVLRESPPVAWLSGVGPHGYEDGYAQYKPPINPEFVKSSHNVYVDWIVMLGVGGVAWVMLSLIWLWRAGRLACTPTVQTDEANRDALVDAQYIKDDTIKHRAALAFILAATVFGTQYALQISEMVAESVLLWMLGAIAFVAITTLLTGKGVREGRWLSAGLFAAAMTTLAHNQIEMTWFQVGSVPVMWVVLAVAGGGRRGMTHRAEEYVTTQRGRSVAIALGLVTLTVVMGMTVTYAGPMVRHQSAMREAAHRLRDGDVRETLHQLREASDVLPHDPTPYQWRARLALEAVIALAREGRQDGAARAIAAAKEAIDEADRAGLNDTSLAIWRARAWTQQASQTKDAQDWAHARVAWDSVLERSPHQLELHLEYADLLWQRGHKADARKVYQRCVLISDASYLDATTQLTESQRQHVADRLDTQVSPD